MAKSIEHNVFPELAPRAEIYEKIGLIEKSWLDHAYIGFPVHLEAMLHDFYFFRINGVQAVFNIKDETLNAICFTPSLFAGIYNQGLPLLYLIHSSNCQLNVCIGTNKSGVPALSALLESILGTDLYESSNISFSRQICNYTHCSAVTGIPTLFDTRKLENRKAIWHSGLNSLVSGLIGEQWTYIIQAFPIKRDQTSQWFESCSREVKDIKEAFLHRDIQKSNRPATYYIEVLEKTLKRLNTGKQQGLWQTGVYLSSSNEKTVLRGAALLSSVHSGDKSVPEPIRCHICSRVSDTVPFINCYNSKELCNFISIPSQEFPGFSVKEQVKFDVDFKTEKNKPVLIGRIKGDNRLYNNHHCSISIDDLTRHGLVAGVTGSGKTNTIFNLLAQTHESYKIPFMVIEPAKSEYRNLLHQVDTLLVFTLGEERPDISTPFRLNPFSFPQGISLQTHIDFLKAVFNASFVMYAPMPYILEECLYKIYEDKGWNLVTSINARGNSEAAFPTLSDLYRKIDEVVDRIGYQDRTTMDIKAALKTRINNLCIGGKGMMLNTQRSVPFSKVMTTPTVFELKYLGNDEEKAFVMGLILMAIWEYYESHQGDSDTISYGLNHLMVIEEAHRLLKNVPTEKVSEDQNNIKGKGVETFCNLLAEIRAYGEGVIVSEQIPTKLAPDVVKNSNFKIMHRIVAKDDRDIMGDAMNFDSHQNRHSCTLNIGEAIFYREGLDRPIKIKAPISEIIKTGTPITNVSIQKNMQEKFYNQNQSLLIKYPACKKCRYFNHQECENIKREVENIRSFNDWTDTGVKFFIPYIINPAWTHSAYEHFHSVIQCNDNGSLDYCLAAQIINDFIYMKGDFFNWRYDEIEKIISEACNDIDTFHFTSAIGKFSRKMANKSEFMYSLCRSFCKQKCLFCYEGSILANDPVSHNRLIDLLNSRERGEWFYHELIDLIAEHIQEYLPLDYQGYFKDLAKCYLIQKLNEHRFSLKLQRQILTEFAETIEKIKI